MGVCVIIIVYINTSAEQLHHLIEFRVSSASEMGDQSHLLSFPHTICSLGLTIQSLRLPIFLVPTLITVDVMRGTGFILVPGHAPMRLPVSILFIIPWYIGSCGDALAKKILGLFLSIQYDTPRCLLRNLSTFEWFLRTSDQWSLFPRPGSR